MTELDDLIARAIETDLSLLVYRDMTEWHPMNPEEICEYVRTIMCAEGHREPVPNRTVKVGVIHYWCRVPLIPGDEMCTLVDPVPAPKIQVDTLRALLEYYKDCSSMAILARLYEQFTNAQCALILRNCEAWAAYWAVWHHRAYMREWFAREHADSVAAREKLQAHPNALRVLADTVLDPRRM